MIALLATTKILMEFVNNLSSNPSLAMLDNTLIPVKVVLLALDLAKLAHQLLFVLHALQLAFLLTQMEIVFLNAEMVLSLATKLVILVSATHLVAFHAKSKMDIAAVDSLHFVNPIQLYLHLLQHLHQFQLHLTIAAHQEVELVSIT